MDDTPLKLAEPLEAFVEEQVRSGAYADRDAVVADAVRRLKADFEGDDAKLERMRATIAAAKARLDRGKGHVVDDLDAYAAEVLREAIGG